MATPDNEQAIAFLELWAKDGPWVLTAIAPDKKEIETRTFSATEKEELKKWLAHYNGERNLYFHVNPMLRRLTKKAQREDVAELAWLHVDIDPRPGEDIEVERQRALKLLENPPGNIPPPTVIIFSGGGYQGFWKLEEPVKVDGDLNIAEDVKRYNQQLEIDFSADNCHNIDRIMRLPGSINLPDARKRKKGRVPTLAELIKFDPSVVYPLSRFSAAPDIQLSEKVEFGSAQDVKISGNVERLNDISDLDEWDIPDRIKVIIVQGEDPDNPREGDNSRSGWLFSCICALLRHDVPDDVIYAIITDPDLGISRSILDKGRNAEKYAVRQIARAKEYIVEPWLMELNEEFAVIGNYGGRCRVVQEIFDANINRSRLTRQSFEDFRNRFLHLKVEVGKDEKTGLPKMKQVGKWWLEHPKRRNYNTIVFEPNVSEVGNNYNLWKGFACEAKDGDCSLFIDHMRNVICNGNEEHFRYLLGWMARAVQHPNRPGEVAVVLRGGRGTGKGTFATEFGKVWGRHFLQVGDPKHLVGSFNAHLRDCVYLFADEAFYAGDKKHESILKMIITEETLMIEGKGQDAETAANYLHVVMASNDRWVVPAGADERRFFVIDLSEERKQDREYFKAIRDQMDNGGREALLHMLLQYDISEYDVRDIPQTEALHEQKMLSLSPEEEWWHQILTEGVMPGAEEWTEDVLKDELWEHYCSYMRDIGIARKANKTAWGKFMSRICPDSLRSVQKKVDIEVPLGDGFVKNVKRRKYVYNFPSLEECREYWDKMFAGYSVWTS